MSRSENIFLKPTDQNDYRIAGRISTDILSELSKLIVIGNTPKQIDTLADKLCKDNQVKPSFKGVPGWKSSFPANICVSVNDETLHTIPYSERKFQSGDIVKLDFGIIYNGLFTDHCITVGLGELTNDEERLIKTAKLCIDTAIGQVKPGNRVGDISNALGTISNMAGFKSIEGYAGHGIGKSIHASPNIPYQGVPGTGELIKEGMVLCIENQISLGTGKLVLDDNGWTLRTKDGSKTAMFEHTVLVTSDGCEILTEIR